VALGYVQECSGSPPDWLPHEGYPAFLPRTDRTETPVAQAQNGIRSAPNPHWTVPCSVSTGHPR
jgi:hypothetical protein